MITVSFPADGNPGPNSGPHSGPGPARRQAFTDAAARWDEVVETAFPPLILDGERLDGLRIEVSIEAIDGDQGVLGQAGPTVLLRETELTAKGVMRFDIADVERLERNDAFADVVLHEMGHVIGVGTLWSRFNLIDGTGGDDPRFTGPNAVREYSALLGTSDAGAPINAPPGTPPNTGPASVPASIPASVPIANTGGPGTREGHWREDVFGDELMTGFLSGRARPLSRLTIAGLEDIGYRVRYDAADEYVLPSFRELSETGPPTALRSHELCRMGRPTPIVMGAP